MIPYIFLFVFVFLLHFFCSQFPSKKTRKLFNTLVFIYIYIFCVIRSFNVGIDIPGYIEMYERSLNMRWEDWHLGHFEPGYIAIMKICHIIGLSARGFFYVVYFLILFPIYYIINNYSVKPIISVVFYLSFQYFTFDLTGLRQAISMSLCLLAFNCVLKPDFKHILKYVGIVCIAASFHKSGWFFLPCIFILRLRINTITLLVFIAAAIFCYVINKVVVNYILIGHKYEYAEEFRLGASLVLYFIVAVFGIYTHKYRLKGNDELRLFNEKVTLMVCTSIPLAFLLNGSILLRANMFYMQAAILSLPIIFSALSVEYRRLAELSFYVVFLTHFFVNELKIFNVSPYEIGQEQAITQ